MTSDVRDRLVGIARDLVGATYPEQRYLDTVAPADRGARALQIGRESGCMLVALRLQDLVYALPAREPYVDTTAPAMLERRAGGWIWQHTGAMRAATLEAPPQPGDLVWYGHAGAFPDHVETVVDVTGYHPEPGWDEPPRPALFFEAVAGGQRTPVGAETIALVQRALDWDAQKRAWIDRATKRLIVGVIDADLMAARHGLREAAA